MSTDVTSPVNPGRIIPARPTTYNGVRMRSRLEAAYAEQFDAFGWRWEYEPECFASPAGQYLPDFRVWPGFYDEAGPTYIEVKPHITHHDQWFDEWDKMVDWWRIIKANDATARAFLLCFGADDDRRLPWFGITGDDHAPRMVIPQREDAHVIVTTDPLAGVIHPRSGEPIQPVASLHADAFSSFTPDRTCRFAIKVAGF